MPRNVLVIEDDIDTGHLITWTLSAVGIRAVLVHSRDDALFRLKTETFDTILMDYSMSGMKAEAFMDWVQMKHPETKVIVITAAGRADLLACKLGADDFIDKPFDPKKLQAQIAAE